MAKRISEEVEEVKVETKKEVKLLKLNLGCGRRFMEGYINVDSRKELNPDRLVDIEKGLPFESNSVDEIIAYDFLEHIHVDKVIFVMQEIHRVLKIGGILDFMVPSTDGRGAFQDPTHNSFWNANSFLYWCRRDWNSLYPELPYFEIETEIVDFWTMYELRILHTKGRIKKVSIGLKPWEEENK